jgi:integrase/recombinase XerD
MGCEEEQDQREVFKLLDDYKSSLAYERGLSVHTQRAYGIDVEAFLRWAHKANLDPLKVTHKQLRSYLAYLDRAAYERSTIKRHLSALRSFYRWAVLAGHLESDPTAVLQAPQAPRYLPHTVSLADAEKLLKVFVPCQENGEQEWSPQALRDTALLEFLFSCGARVSEASGLRLDAVNFSAREVKVFGKRSKERLIPLSKGATEALRRYLEEGRPALLQGKQNDFFFVSTRGNVLSTDAIRKIFKKALRLAGLDESLSPHSLRHTFATQLVEGGADMRSVQEMLGHASLSTTQIYTHLSLDHLKQVHAQTHPRG